MKNKLIEQRIKLNLTQRNIADLANCSYGTIATMELGRCKVPNTITDMWYNISKAYQLSIGDLITYTTLNYQYRQLNDIDFLSEIGNTRIVNDTNSVGPNKASTKLFNDSIKLGFYNTADRTAYNKYCKEHKIELSIDEWHVIKKKMEADFLAEHGITQAQYKLVQSLTRCARKVGFGDDYKKYSRWKNYKNTHANPVSIEEWSKLDDIKQANIARNKKSKQELARLNKIAIKHNIKKTIELGLDDIQQYYRWVDYNQQIKNPTISIEEWKELDRINMTRLNNLRTQQENIDITKGGLMYESN